MNINKITKKDFNAWLGMRKKLWPGFSDHLNEMTDLFSDPKFIAFIVVSDKGVELGFLEASIRPYANGCKQRPVVFCEGLWVDESVRSQQVGFKLMQRLEVWAKEQGFKEICSDCELDNNISQSAHKKWGFKETERVIYYQKDI